jgi:hypothetical protein
MARRKKVDPQNAATLAVLRRAVRGRRLPTVARALGLPIRTLEDLIAGRSGGWPRTWTRIRAGLHGRAPKDYQP